MRILSASEEHFEVAMTPLIDMVFLLIIFFLVSTAFVDPERDQLVHLAEVSEGGTAKKTREDFVVNVRQGGVYVVSGRVLTLDDLSQALAAAAKADPKQIVRIRGDALAYHKHIVKAYEACAKAGIRNVFVVARLAQ